MTMPSARRFLGIALVLLGAGMAAGGLYMLYGRFAFDLPWWADSPAAGEQFRRLDERVAQYRATVSEAESLLAEARADVPGPAGEDDDLRKAEEALRGAQTSREVAQVENAVAAARAKLERRRDRWLVRGGLLTVLGLAAVARGAVLAAADPLPAAPRT